LTVVLVLGVLTLMLGILITNTSYINFPVDRDDYEAEEYEEYERDVEREEDISSLQYLFGATFIHAGVGMVLIFTFLGVIANDTIGPKPRIVMLVVSTSLLIMWIYYCLLAGLLSKFTWASP